MHNPEARFNNIKKSRVFNNILDILDLRDKAVLDIGCSSGEFLIHFGKESVGVTVRDDEVAYGKTKNLDIRNINIENDIRFEKKFDAIFANNIFEHMESPHLFLRKISTFLKDDGLLVLGVPCVPKISSLIEIKKFRGSLSEAHINFFTKETLSYTVKYGGYKVLDTRGYRFKNYILDHLFDLAYPHFYVTARPIKDFQYPKKRREELGMDY
jgi:SAM-dependent methyltransferase